MVSTQIVGTGTVCVDSPPSGSRAAITESRPLAGLTGGATAGSILRDLGRGGGGGGRSGRSGRSGSGGGRSGRGEDTATGRTVPVSLVISKALADGNSSVTSILESLEHELGQVLGGLLVDVVSDGEEVVVGRVLASEGVREVVLGVLDLVRGGVVVVISVQIEVGDVVAESLQVVLAARLGGARRVRGAHVGGEETEDVPEGHLVLDHLVLALSRGNGAQVLVAPGVGGDLVALRVHPLDDSVPAVGGVVDLALAVVVAGDEEGGLGVVLLQHVEHAVGVDVGTIVVGQGDLAVHDTVIDTSTTILDGALQVTGNGRGVSSGRHGIGVAGRAVVELAVRRHAVLGADTTPSLKLCQEKKSVAREVFFNSQHQSSSSPRCRIRSPRHTGHRCRQHPGA